MRQKEDINSDLFDRFCLKIGSFENIDQQKAVAVAVSGGSDSMALVLLTKEWAKQYDINVVALIVDHGLRSESSQEAIKVGNWLADNEIESKILKWKGPKPISNIQSKARDARYDLLVEFCKSKKIEFLLLGHNIEDQAETILQRIMRGSGLDGICGIPHLRSIGDVKIIRPLMDFYKKEIKDFLIFRNQEWIEDPSNKNEQFLRVNVRNFINNADDSSLLVRRLADMAENLSRSKSLIDEIVKEKTKQIVTFEKKDSCYININQFKDLHEEIAFKMMANILVAIGDKSYKPRFEKLKRLVFNMQYDDFKSCTLAGCIIKKQKTNNHHIEIRKLNTI